MNHESHVSSTFIYRILSRGTAMLAASLFAVWSVTVSCSTGFSGCRESRTCPKPEDGGEGGGAGAAKDESPAGSGGATDGAGGAGIEVGDFEIHFDSRRIDVVAGSSITIRLTIERGSSHESSIDISASGLPEGVTVADVTAAPDAEVVELKFIADLQEAMLGSAATVRIEATDGSSTKTVQCSLLVRGVPGSVDTTFGSNGVAYWNGAGNDFVNGRIEVLADDRILVGGAATLTGSQAVVAMRFSPEGTLDKTFGESGIAGRAPGRPLVSPDAFGLLEDGTIVVAASALDFSKVPPSLPVQFRVTADGSPDLGFGVSGFLAYEKVFAFKDFSFANGRSLFVGVEDFQASDGTGVVGRLDAEGYLDSEFGAEGLMSWPQVDKGGFLSVIHDGQAYVATGGCGTRACLARFDADGDPDDDFGPGGVLTLPTPNASVSDIVINAIGQYFAIGDDGAGDWLLARVTQAGQVLAVVDSFTTGQDRATHVTTDVDGYVVLGVAKAITGAQSYSPIVVKYDINLQRDAGFGVDGVVDLQQDTPAYGTTGIARQADGRLIVGYTLRGAGTLVLKRIWN